MITLERYDSTDDSWYARPGNLSPDSDIPSGNWIAAGEIEEIVPTEELDKQAAELFGVGTPANHCPTCTCRS